jgi:hypothetical protein
LTVLTYPELGNFLVKRVIALPGKLIGFKPVCLVLATVLLERSLIGEWVWFSVLVVVMFGIVGLRTIQAVFER